MQGQTKIYSVMACNQDSVNQSEGYKITAYYLAAKVSAPKDFPLYHLI